MIVSSMHGAGLDKLFLMVFLLIWNLNASISMDGYDGRGVGLGILLNLVRIRIMMLDKRYLEESNITLLY
jgi:hypothetical protein